MEKKLEQLLLEKKFQELTAEEKYYVTDSIGEAEYNRMHNLLKESKTTLKNTPPVNPAIKNNLMAAFRQHHGIDSPKNSNTIIRLMRYRIPAWQAAAAIALLLGLHFWLQEESIIIEKPETVYVHSVDTIYKEVAMPAPAIEKSESKPPVRINVKPKMQQPVPQQNEPAIVAAIDSAALKYEASQVPDSFNLMVSQPRGKSATQTADLWQLLGEVY